MYLELPIYINGQHILIKLIENVIQLQMYSLQGALGEQFSWKVL